MFSKKFQRKYALTDQGVRNTKKGAFWTVIVNLVVMGGMGILYLLMYGLMGTLTDGAPLPGPALFLGLVIAFVILAFVTAVVAIGHWGGKVIPVIKIETPMALTFPIKILANIGALMLVVGLGLLTWRRMRLNPKYQASSFQDWYLLGVIWVVAITGILAQCFRLADAIVPAFVIYYLHLVFVWMLFAYLPWSKLGHLVYRTAALLYVRMYGRP